MSAFIIRRWWLIRNRFISSIALALVVPSILSTVTVLGTKNIVIRSINGQPYEVWVLPGLMMFMGAILITPLIYRDFFDLRIHNKALIPMTLAPVRKSTIILGILISALFEVLAVMSIGLGIYNIIFPQTVTISHSFNILSYAIIFVLLYGNIIILLSLLTERISVFISAILTTLITIMFACGVLIEFDFFPLTMSTVFQYFPLSMVSIACRSNMFIHTFDTFNTITPIVMTILLIIFNSYLLKRKMKQ
ncbi:MAG TPA: hypothetical protein QGF08_01595 [Candidatus Marinimicrobia bacterium]|jgi:hypothetical protein|nr:hypothetical protein [Candidatus Neomarinimicrobiota bacterium]MDP6275676.1 hypothetical protein [Candidatus Neomarinimicrobiota bacterium]MDP7217230.1 hypothetical protein [Candidatus Neomarinimicrobiota bacterium]HJM69557.1 hypothetical protein [Candidatus Neomarinimicrobiota bacterium]|tara:strand:+ start:906 stop:1652 length:747 start_codon:yes stop_codon:yes gene_type:complete